MSLSETGILGIGLGPANLSLAALLHGTSSIASRELRSVFLETNLHIQWHPGQMFPQAKMQNSILRDLVTLADPTNRFTFLCFLKAKHRMLQFLNSGAWLTTREEFCQYFRWVADNLPNLQFSAAVDQIDFRPETDSFIVTYAKDGHIMQISARHIVIGSGFQPFIVGNLPPQGNNIHVSSFLDTPRDVADKNVVIIGSGQSAAEVMHYLLDQNNPPDQITWVSRRHNIKPLDTGNFTREIYSPAFVAAYYSSLQMEKDAFTRSEQAAESGISPALLESLFQLIYYRKHVSQKRVQCSIYPGTEVLSIENCDGSYSIRSHRRMTGGQISFKADMIIQCTGFGVPRLPAISINGHRITFPSKLMAKRNYSLEIQDIPANRIFSQSFAGQSHGLSDRHFTMVAHRNAVIINEILNCNALPVDNDDALVYW